MYEFVRFYVCSFQLQFLMPYEDSDNPNSIFYVFRERYNIICVLFARQRTLQTFTKLVIRRNNKGI